MTDKDIADDHDVEEVLRIANLVAETQPLWGNQLKRVINRLNKAEANLAGEWFDVT